MNWRREKIGTQVFSELPASERMPARVWPDKLKANGRKAASSFNAKTYLMRGLMHLLGPRFVLPSLAVAEFADRNKYAGNPVPLECGRTDMNMPTSFRPWRTPGSPLPLRAQTSLRPNRDIAATRRTEWLSVTNARESRASAGLEGSERA
ncbi:hypothetical protein AWB74_07607 [Caballeronia arvi]|uniref:Uncharacterized protein n=1 Tax=Caballeronia arvi TaxID=1777135 RepID=A0A158KZN3_9BURK|nr:hypothetical protein [Caballeronia arvi]SAL86209.1 hypothetical protein AWB74_07607 [Caballeronia arvi]